ncbi:unnamed protein product, partial [Pylaiella littoralis]
ETELKHYGSLSTHGDQRANTCTHLHTRECTPDSTLSSSAGRGTHALAKVAAEHRYGGGLNLIQLDASTITIHKRTYTTDYTETLEIGVETDTNRNKMHFPRFETVTIPHTGPPGYSCFIRITSSCGDDLQLVDTRTVSSGGLSHIQELHAVNVTTWEEIKTTRVWVRVPMTCEHYTTLAQTPVARRQSSS